MPACIVRYHCTVVYEQPGFVHERQTIGVFEEEREFDDWDDPGRLVRRKALRFEGPGGAVMFEQVHSGTCHGWAYRIGERIGPLEWAQR